MTELATSNFNLQSHLKSGQGSPFTVKICLLNGILSYIAYFN